MAKPGRMITPAGIKKILNTGLDSCEKACVTSGVTGEAEFTFALDGVYAIDKEGDIGLKASISYIDGIPVDLEPSGVKEFDSEGEGNISLVFKVRMTNDNNT